MAAVIVIVVGVCLGTAASALLVARHRHATGRLPEPATGDATPAVGLPGPAGPSAGPTPAPPEPLRPPTRPRVLPGPVPRSATRRYGTPVPRIGGAWGPLSALSAVEKRGRLARIDTVAFVEGPSGGTVEPLADAGPDAAPGPPTGTDQAVAAPEQAVKDQLDVRTTRKLRATCQILHVERVGPGTLIDLVTLCACQVGGEAVPAGTPLALGFGPVPPGAACQDLEAVMGYWEAIGAVVDLEVAESSRLTRYRFDCRDDGLALLVQSERA